MQGNASGACASGTRREDAAVARSVLDAKALVLCPMQRPPFCARGASFGFTVQEIQGGSV